jgi:hypothetical protein
VTVRNANVEEDSERESESWAELGVRALQINSKSTRQYFCAFIAYMHVLFEDEYAYIKHTRFNKAMFVFIEKRSMVIVYVTTKRQNPISSVISKLSEQRK